MSITSIPAFKTHTMADSSVLSLPSLFYNKTKCHFLSTPFKPLQLQFSQSNFSLFSQSLPLTKRSHRSSTLTFVAQTSDWAQQGEGDAVAVEDEDEPAWENEDTETRLSGWEPEGGDAGIEDSESEGDGVFEEREEESFVEPPEDAKIYVGNLPYDVDSQKLAMLFEQAGTVEIAEVIYNRETDRSRGFGFITMSTVEESEKAVEKFNRYELDGRLLTVNKAAPRGARPERPPQVFEPAFRVYAGNLPWNVDNAQLEELFSEHGKVVSARVVYDRDTGRSRGFGFVAMSSETEMNDAIAALDGQSLDGRAIRVNVAEERPRRSSF